MKTIELTQGKVALVDDDCFSYLNQHKWTAMRDKRGKLFYALRAEKKRWVRMHHLVLGISSLPKSLGLNADHLDGDGLNNQRANLRIVTTRENHQNQSRHRGGRLIGCYLVNKNRWMARIRHHGEQKYLGVYATELEAHSAYKKELEKL